MKKYVKSTAALLMVATLAFSATACGDKKDPSKNPDDGGTTTVITVNDYYENLFKAPTVIKGYKTKEVTIDASDYLAVGGNKSSYTDTYESVTAFTEKGRDYYSKSVETSSTQESATATPTEETNDWEYYEVDGVMYSQSSSSYSDGDEEKSVEYWSIYPEDSVAEGSVSVIPPIVNEFNTTDIMNMLADYKDELIAVLGNGTTNGTDYTVNYKIDMKNTANAALGVLGKIELKYEDEQATDGYHYTTIAEVLDVIFKEAGIKVGAADLTTAFLVEQFAGLGEVTVGEAVAAIEGMLGMTLDQLKDKVMASSVVTTIAAKMTELAAKPEYTEIATQVTSVITQIGTFKIADVLTEDIKAMTMDQVLAMVYPMIMEMVNRSEDVDPSLENGGAVMTSDVVEGGEGGEGEVVAPTFADISLMVNEYLNMSVIDLVKMIVSLQGAPEEALAEVEQGLLNTWEQIKVMSFTAFSMEFTLVFDNTTGKLTDLVYATDIGYEFAISQTEKISESSKMTASVELLYETPTITAPTENVYASMDAFKDWGVVSTNAGFVNGAVQERYFDAFDKTLTICFNINAVRIEVEFSAPTTLNFTSLTGKIVSVDGYSEDELAAALQQYGLTENVTLTATIENGVVTLDVTSITPTVAE
ncbi:MAG: hypothetical protein IJY62_05530 [Clostridia bacterium]|nr:hypothetical protein [Clostridia bacterium]